MHEVSIPALEAGLAAYYILAMSEASSNLSRYDGIRYGRRTQVCSWLPAEVSQAGNARGNDAKTGGLGHLLGI